MKTRGTIVLWKKAPGPRKKPGAFWLPEPPGNPGRPEGASAENKAGWGLALVDPPAGGGVQVLACPILPLPGSGIQEAGPPFVPPWQAAASSLPFPQSQQDGAQLAHVFLVGLHLAGLPPGDNGLVDTHLLRQLGLGQLLGLPGRGDVKFVGDGAL